MSVKTKNVYGKISISDKTIELYVAHTAVDSYGIVKPDSSSIVNRIWFFSKLKKYHGVKVKSSGDRIFIDIEVFVKFGVSIKAVVESLKESIRYKVEKFTGMVVDTINVYVKGVKK